MLDVGVGEARAPAPSANGADGLGVANGRMGSSAGAEGSSGVRAPCESGDVGIACEDSFWASH